MAKELNSGDGLINLLRLKLGEELNGDLRHEPFGCLACLDQMRIEPREMTPLRRASGGAWKVDCPGASPAVLAAVRGGRSSTVRSAGRLARPSATPLTSSS
jgi:hypothetical protein